jgi:hypothetical protein
LTAAKTNSLSSLSIADANYKLWISYLTATKTTSLSSLSLSDV